MHLTHRLLVALALGGAATFAAAAPTLAERIAQHDGWSGWRVPMVQGVGTPCCFDWRTRGGTQTCTLDSHNWNFGRNDDDPRPAGAQDLDVYVHVSNGRIDRTRAFAATCALSGTEQVRKLDAVTSAESITLLADAAEHSTTQDAADGALATLALHADPAATPALKHLADAAQPRKLREQALFWLGQARGAEGARVVQRVATGSDDDDLRANAVFDLSQAHGVDAYATIRRIAESDRSAHVREQALFWMAQMGDKRAKDDIFAAIARESSDDVRKQAVFALSQLKHDEADAALIEVVRGDYPRKAREQALFWLGQSGSTRALDFLDDMLTRSGSHPARR